MRQSEIHAPAARPALDVLSARERQVLALIGEGLTMREIAERMFRTVKTVEWYRACLGRKLNIRNRVQLARIAIDAGLVGPDGNNGRGADRYFRAVAAAGACVFEFDPGRGDLYLSEHGADMLGLDERPIGPAGWMERVHPDDRRTVSDAARAALAAGAATSQVVFRVLDGDRRPVRVLARGSGSGDRLTGVLLRLGERDGAAT
ncbi:MAG: helix-turn-helix transcriptional regulator [Phycisphaeraceae bacterium]|nr:helix-turn-helix transcriptional regulator [Phycisphaeraceae bacterium]